jgi:hypothetical protein
MAEILDASTGELEAAERHDGDKFAIQREGTRLGEGASRPSDP